MTGTVSIEGRNIGGFLFPYGRKRREKAIHGWNFAGLGKVEEGTDGNVAWEMNAMQGARIKTGEEHQEQTQIHSGR